MRLRDFFKLHPMFPVVVLFSLAVSVTSYYLQQRTIALIELTLGILLAVIVYLAEKKSFSDLKKTVSILNANVISKTEDRVSSIPLPFVVCASDGSIIWYNNLFQDKIVGDKGLSYKQIKNFVPADKLKDDLSAVSFNANYNGRRYTVHVSKLIDDTYNDYVLYFIDDTYYKDIADKYNDTRPAVMLVSIDAMDDVSSLISQNDFSALISDAERLITAWFSHYQCILRKTSEGRFLIITDYITFSKMKANKFDIIEQVRDYRHEGISTGLTMSVGIGTGMELVACEAASRKSLDMAKGRGGDQVVINDSDNYEFFGGVVSGVESKNQVQSRIVAGSVEELIKHSSSVLVVGHKNSDLDSLGSAIGLSEIVKHLGIKVKIVVDEKASMAKPLLERYKEKCGEAVFISPEKASFEIQNDTLLIVTDVMRPSFTDAPKLLEKAHRKVVIDHHRMSVDYISDSLIFYHEPNSSSTSEMVTELIRYMPSKPKLTKTGAEALLSGIYLDTKNFTLKTGVRTFEAAAYLKDCGANTITVRKLFAASADENAVISKIVNSASINANFAVAATDIKDPVIRLAAAKAADELLNIEGIDASFVIFKVDSGDISISARSYGIVNVQLIMEKLGGGGHLTMAAAQLKDSTLEDAENKLNEAIEDFIKNNPKKDIKRED